jgi:hypothetical protein
MWKVYKWNGHYIMGDLISKHSTESAAISAATKNIHFTSSEKTKRDKVITIWLDNEEHSPVGCIIKKTRG